MILNATFCDFLINFGLRGLWSRSVGSLDLWSAPSALGTVKIGNMIISELF